MSVDNTSRVGDFGNLLLNSENLTTGATSLYNLATTGSFAGAATTAGEVGALAGAGSTGLSAALPGIGLALMAGAWIGGAANKASFYSDQIGVLKKGIGNIDRTLTSGATKLRFDMQKYQDIVADRVTSSSLAVGEKLSGGVKDSLSAAIKKGRGIKSGDIEATEAELTGSIEDSLNAQRDVLLASSDQQVQSMGEQWADSAEQAGIEVEQMREKIKYAKKHDDWYENLV
tara:strand:+ start:975 stop:1664 length:690 start_codon:yes stop_codon:yes gene_type:complete